MGGSKNGAPADADDLDALLSEETASLIKSKRQPENESDCWVLPENWIATMLFLQSKSCWQYSAMGQLLGMNYSAVDVVIQRAFDEPVTNTDFRNFQILEHHFISEINAS